MDLLTTERCQGRNECAGVQRSSQGLAAFVGVGIEENGDPGSKGFVGLVVERKGFNASQTVQQGQRVSGYDSVKVLLYFAPPTPYLMSVWLSWLLHDCKAEAPIPVANPFL